MRGRVCVRACERVEREKACLCACEAQQQAASGAERRGEGFAEGGFHRHTADQGLHCVVSLPPPNHKNVNSLQLFSKGDSSVESNDDSFPKHDQTVFSTNIRTSVDKVCKVGDIVKKTTKS